jgi:2-succinyl-5-enolpyruvyl-6-hydroxy-3-cyclohexene-1-carboxylate synthase
MLICFADVSAENDLKSTINTAISQKVPVHINAPFEEPLYETVSELQSVKNTRCK